MPSLPAHRRLFIALDLPADTRSELARLGREAATDGAMAVPRGNLHITLAFLGDVRRPVADRLVPDLFDACRGPAHRAALGSPQPRPHGERARLVAVEIVDPDGSIGAQAACVADVVRSLLDDRGKHRPFWPHVTVARFRRPTRVRRSPIPQSEHVFAIDRVTLYDSVTSSTGPPVYRPIMTVPLDVTPERNIPHG